MLDEQFDQSGVVRKDIDGPRLNLCEHTRMEVVNFKCHVCMLANTLTLCKWGNL